MNDKTSVTIAGDWSKPAQTLIEKIGDAIGGGLKPWQIRRVAKAEADAEAIRAEGEAKRQQILAAADLDDSPLGQRAIKRMVAQEVRKQENIEIITRLALEQVRDDAKPENVSRDFLSDLFDKASNTSDSDMQELWASILAGETNAPGKFSRRAISIVAQLDKKEAELFTKFCACAWMVGNTLDPLLTKNTQNEFEKLGVGFSDYMHLEAIGLISYNPLGYGHQSKLETFPVRFIFHYFGSPILLEIDQSPAEVQIGNAIFTSEGRQLAEISGAVADYSLRDAALADVMNMNTTVLSPWPKQAGNPGVAPGPRGA